MLVESRCDIQARYHQLGFSLEACIEVIPYNTKSDLSIRLIHVDCRERDRAPTLVQRRSLMNEECVMKPIGKKRWAIAEGYIPPSSNGPHPEMTSHETVCVLNAGPRDAHVESTVFYADRGPVGPYRLVVPAERTRHVRFNDLKNPAPIPADTDFASLIDSDVPIVVQHTRLDSWQAENALMSTIAFSGNE
jgi:hypothetical protein